MLGLESIFTLGFSQMAHNLRQLHFSQFIEFFCFEHSSFNFSHGLCKDLDLLVGEVGSLDAHGAQKLPSTFVPRVHFQVVRIASGPRLQKRFLLIFFVVPVHLVLHCLFPMVRILIGLV